MNKVIKYLETLYPYYQQEHYDHSGYQFGQIKEDVKKIVICLDYETEVYKQCLDIKPDLIITHHPFFFGDKREIYLNDDIKRELAINTINNLNCSVYSFHTCFDNDKYGMNYLASNILKLKNVKRYPLNNGFFYGELEKEMDFDSLCKYVREKFNLSYVLGCKNNEKTIKNIGIVLGGASSYYKEAVLLNLDAYISGDFSHHIRRGIHELGLNYIDIPHEVETLFLSKIKQDLEKEFNDLDIYLIDNQKQPKCY